MLQKTVGIVLHTLKYNDTSNIVDIYTRENGRASFLVSVPRSRKSAVKTVLFQPLSMIVCLFGAFYPVAGRMRQKFLQFSFGFSDAFFTFPRSVS